VIGFGAAAPLVDGEMAVPDPDAADRWWSDGRRIAVETTSTDGLERIDVRIEGDGPPLASLGVRFRVEGVARYLRNGYHSWDGAWFAVPGDAGAGEGHGFTVLDGGQGESVLLGFERHDRFQTRFRFAVEGDALVVDAETLLDRSGAADSETLLRFACRDSEALMRRWSELVAAASPLPPRVPDRRITGWCSWYNLYASITPDTLREHLHAAAAFRDRQRVPLEVFLIDDGFNPEMGDWIDFKPQFPDGVAPLLAEAEALGFRPGLWIAPFMVGNRSRLAAEHPEWLVRDARTGAPWVEMRFYGEFRWHKRSEEYYVLDVTHPGAAAYIAEVFRTWRHDWGARYFKTDFMHFGSAHGPDEVAWHLPGLSRIQVWRRIGAIIRESIGEDALWSGCGCPLWASVGLVDAVRISRDVGVSWDGEQSHRSLFRDLPARLHANGVLWQADPDCILLRDRFHDLSDEQVRLAAETAAGAGGVLMTSDHLGELSPEREALFARRLRGCG
jgi:alpha-galactosidase